MLSPTLAKALNEQINLEFYSSNLYLQMSSWCINHGLDGCANFFRQHADEEKMHMQKLFDYVNETGAYAIIGTIQNVQAEYSSVVEIFEETYAHEQHITRKINELVSISFKEADFSTFNFLQWYVAEQHEEEQLFKSILDKVELIGLEGNGLFFIDKEIENLHANRAPLNSTIA
ncbi:MAG: ferritin [Gammaproteobacteria bacterium]|nr:MAG: ferritin [Gammaproteobacteria bacterium]